MYPHRPVPSQSLATHITSSTSFLKLCCKNSRLSSYEQPDDTAIPVSLLKLLIHSRTRTIHAHCQPHDLLLVWNRWLSFLLKRFPFQFWNWRSLPAWVSTEASYVFETRFPHPSIRFCWKRRSNQCCIVHHWLRKWLAQCTLGCLHFFFGAQSCHLADQCSLGSVSRDIIHGLLRYRHRGYEMFDLVFNRLLSGIHHTSDWNLWLSSPSFRFPFLTLAYGSPSAWVTTERSVVFVRGSLRTPFQLKVMFLSWLHRRRSSIWQGFQHVLHSVLHFFSWHKVCPMRGRAQLEFYPVMDLGDLHEENEVIGAVFSPFVNWTVSRVCNE